MIKPGDEPIAGYRVEALLGRGQFGEVWRARSPGNTTVALKFLQLTAAHGWKEYRAIQRVKEIRHAHLMPIVAIWLLDDDGRVLDEAAIKSIAESQRARETLVFGGGDTLVVEPPQLAQQPAQLIVATLLADQSLCDRLKECQADGLRGIPVEELLNAMGEAAKGLDFLNSPQHKIGETVGAVQHCDVKPDNIMLAGGSVVIADFGVAQTLAQARLNTTATSLGGTPAYMAPELFVNRPSKTSDQYSLAVTYYELRTGRLPFVEQTYAAVYQAHREGTLDFSGVTPAEKQVLRRATATDPEQRFETCSEFVDALREGVNRAPTEKRSPRKSLAGPALAAALAVLATGGLGYGVYRWVNRPIPTPPGRVVIVVDPPGAAVTIDGQAVAANAAGEIVAERPIGQAFVVQASAPPERLDARLEVKTEAEEQRRELALPFSALHFANEAKGLIAGGAVSDEAVAAYAQAIKLDPETYARLPDPAIGAAGAVAIRTLQISPSGRRLALASRDRTIHQWSIDDNEPARQGSVVERAAGEVLALAATDQWTATLAEGAGDHTTLVLDHVDGRSFDLRVPEATGKIKQIAITGDGRTLVAASEVWKFEPTRKGWVLHKWRLDAPDVPGSYETLQQHEGEFEPILAGAHRQNWVALITNDGESWFVRLCPADSQAETAPIYQQGGELTEVVVSPDDRLVAVGGNAVSDNVDQDDYNATVIDADSKRAQTLKRSHADSICALAFDAATSLLAVGDKQGHAQAWTIPPGWDASRQIDKAPIFLRDGTDEMAAIACPRKNWVACCVHGRVALWDCQTDVPKVVNLAAPDSNVTAMVATPDGRWLVTGHIDGSLRFWNLPQIILVFRACAAAGEPLRVPAPNPSASDTQASISFPSGPLLLRAVYASAVC